MNSKLANQWHATKNGNLNSKEVKPNSGSKAWWKCEKGYEWKAIFQRKSEKKNGADKYEIRLYLQ